MLPIRCCVLPSGDCKHSAIEVGLPRWHSVKNTPANTRDTREAGSIPGSGRSPGGGNGNTPHYSCLGNSTDRGAWRATVHRITKELEVTERAHRQRRARVTVEYITLSKIACSILKFWQLLQITICLPQKLCQFTFASEINKTLYFSVPTLLYQALLSLCQLDTHKKRYLVKCSYNLDLTRTRVHIAAAQFLSSLAHMGTILYIDIIYNHSNITNDLCKPKWIGMCEIVVKI